MPRPTIIILPDTDLSAQEVAKCVLATNSSVALRSTQIIKSSNTKLRKHQIHSGDVCLKDGWNNYPVLYRISVWYFLAGRISGLW